MLHCATSAADTYHSAVLLEVWQDEAVLLQNWAEMETEYRQVQEECQELHSLLGQRDDQLCTLKQSLLDLTVRMKVHSSVLITASPEVAATTSCCSLHIFAEAATGFEAAIVMLAWPSSAVTRYHHDLVIIAVITSLFCAVLHLLLGLADTW